MSPNYLLGFTVLLAVCYVEISCRPSNNESTTVPEEISAKEPKAIADKEDGSIYYQADTDINAPEENTKEIVDRIKAINSVLNKPRRPQINYNSPYSENSNGIDEETLQRIKQIIALEKLNPYSKTKNQPKSHDLSEDDRNPYSRSFRVMPNMVYPNTIPMMSYYYPYHMNYPVLVAPNTNDILTKYATYNDLKSAGPSDVKSAIPGEKYQTRQEQQPLFPGFPSFPSFSFDNLFQFQPFSQLFPVLIKNPFVAFTQGGGFENFIEYGQNADVCSRRQKSSDDKYSEIIKKLVEENVNLEQSDNKRNDDNTISETNTNTRESRALRKRTIVSGAPAQQVDNKNPRKIYTTKPSITRKTTKKPVYTEEDENLKSDADGSLRFPFGNGFSWFGDRKPVAPSPGFFINRLRVRKGGVAIAGPGGVATAGNGGTAIVGPGGLAYTKPGGLAIAGPAARVVALSQHHDFNDFVSRAAKLDNKSRSSMPIREGKLVATGPVIYYHPTETPTEETLTDRFLEAVKNFRQNRQGIVTDVYNYDGEKFVRNLDEDPTFVIHLSPRASAVSGEKGIAISNPISRVVIRRGEVASIVHSPRATAVAGAGGIAHAEATQYIPFYGGGKGQYLEVKRDTKGAILSERVVAEDSISSENILKNNDENLLSKVLAVNLQNLKSLASNLLRIHNLGRKTGTLGDQERIRFRNQLFSLGEAASNTIKLIDEIGEDVDVLFKRNATLSRQYGENYEEDVGEEGIGIDSIDSGESYDGSIIAEAKPVGLAVIGENGLAASRPMATAVASSGVAIASPIATAIAGIDPSYLNINLHGAHQKSYKINGKYSN
ncbi:uncharacterized protein LOC123866768 [Maniola jurtina]|uniref:uncharacterized protein LOC123866768 n=1 Tax=Maniola jurtina TaxID=191418 RepID=UPI001E68A278|nr:uncharacterized protein LOC123866768 [Maniola jurtina]